MLCTNSKYKDSKVLLQYFLNMEKLCVMYSEYERELLLNDEFDTQLDSMSDGIITGGATNDNKK